MSLGVSTLGTSTLGTGVILGGTPPTFQPTWVGSSYFNEVITMFKKNTAVTGFVVGLVSSTDGSDITTGTPVGYYTLDGGTQTAIGDITPVHEGNGLWSFDLLASEMNGDIVGLSFTHTSAISTHFTIKTSILTTDDTLLSDVVSISGDTTAADNLELQYDTTGLTGDTFPSTQASVRNIATGSAAISVIAESDIVTTGTEVNTFSVTDELNQTYHEITDIAGVMEVYYQFDVGGNGIAATVDMVGRLIGANDIIGVYAYNWGASTWDQIGSIQGANSTTDGDLSFNLLTRHTGTGVNLGKVRVRGYAASGLTSSTLYIDQAYVSYAVVAQSVGYALGRIWVDTVDGTPGTETYVNGVAETPVNSITDALILSGSTKANLSDFHISSDSTFAPSVAIQGHNIYGIGYTCTLGGQDFSGSHIFHASPITGKAVTVGGTDHFDCVDSIIGNVEVDDAHFTGCSFNGTITLDQVNGGDLKIVDSRSIIAGSSTPIIECGVAAVTHNISISNWQNGLEVRNLNNGGSNLFSISGTGKLVVASTCSGTMNVRGPIQIIDNSSGAVTFVYDNIHENTHLILEDTETTLPAQISSLNNISASDIFTAQMTEAYAVDGTAPTLAQALFLIQQSIGDFSIAGTTLTAKRLDGTSIAATYTLDDSANPTSRTRAT